MNDDDRLGVVSSRKLTYEDILEAVQKMEDFRRFEEMRTKEVIRRAVIICNRENKYKIKQAIPELCVLGTDVCDDKVYMVTDKELAENIRRGIKD